MNGILDMADEKLANLRYISLKNTQRKYKPAKIERSIIEVWTNSGNPTSI